MSEEYLNILSAVREAVVTCAAITGVIIAAMGLTTWRKQIRGRAEYELARRVLRAAIQVRNALKSIRENVTLGLEDISQRWKEVREAISDLHVELLETEVLWGKEVENRLQPLFSALGDYRIALIRLRRAEAGKGRPLDDQEFEELDGIVYDMGDDASQDSFAARLDDAIEPLKAFLKPKLHL